MTTPSFWGGMETVLITGCSSGIGRATARVFLDDEWRVYATARDLEDVAELGEAGCETLELDVTNGNHPREVVDHIVDQDGQLDCLVNNAGYAQFGPLEDVPLRDVHRQFDVNVYGPHRLHRAVLPHMRSQGSGRIINISSSLGRLVLPGGGAYCASKFALEAMSDALRAEVAEFGIEVVLIEPGAVETQFAERAQTEVETGIDRSDAYDALYRGINDVSLLGRERPFASEPGDVAEVILNAATCADPESRYPVGPSSRLVERARWLPDRWRDLAYRFVRALLR